MEVLSEAPRTSSFTPLTEHQTTTPASFYNGPPVLHYYSDRCKLIVLKSEVDSVPALASLVTKAATAAAATRTNTNGTNAEIKGANGSEEAEEGSSTIEEVDVWVTSDKLLLYSTQAQTGISISYPSISLHAIQSLPQPTPNDTTSQGLYMQIMNTSQSGNNSNEEDEDLDSISVTVIPTASAPPSASTTSTTPNTTVDEAVENEDIPETTPVQAMFTALSNCSNLHPDPVQEGDEDEEGRGGGAAIAFEGEQDGNFAQSEFFRAGLLQPGNNDGSGGLPPPMPGSGGWITAENMHEYFDENGEWIGPSNEGGDDDDVDMEEEDGDEDAAQGPAVQGTPSGTSQPLGPGAGQVRRADDGDGDAENGEETKWRRTD